MPAKLLCPAGQGAASVAATNVLRALRQSKEAAALGLLEGQAQASAGRQDIEVCQALADPLLRGSLRSKV